MVRAGLAGLWVSVGCNLGGCMGGVLHVSMCVSTPGLVRVPAILASPAKTQKLQNLEAVLTPLSRASLHLQGGERDVPPVPAQACGDAVHLQPSVQRASGICFMVCERAASSLPPVLSVPQSHASLKCPAPFVSIRPHPLIGASRTSVFPFFSCYRFYLADADAVVVLLCFGDCTLRAYCTCGWTS